MALRTTLFNKSPSGIYGLMFASIFAVGLMLTDNHSKALTAPVRHTINGLLGPVYAVVGWPGRFASWTSSQLRPVAELRDENAYLRTQLLTLSVRVQKFSELAAENARLRGLINSTLTMDGHMLISDVIGVDPDPYRHIVMLGKGESSGVYVGQPVFDLHGLLGQVIETGPGVARVLLVTDRQHRVPVRINRTGTRGVLAGTGDYEHMQLLYVPESADVKVGDQLVTSGLGQRFPAGYPVAIVTAVSETGGADFAVIDAKPVAEVDRSQQVMLMFTYTRPSLPKPLANSGEHSLAQ